MNNKQPVYHRVTFLFTAFDEEFTTQDLQATLRRVLSLQHKAILSDTIIVEECDAEVGDPQDLIS